MNKAIYDQLQTQTKDWLIQRLAELADDSKVHDRLLLYLGTQNSQEQELIAEFKSKLDRAIEQIQDHGPANWKSEVPVSALDNIVDTLAETVLKGKLTTVLDVSEYALLKIDSIMELQDECELDYLIDAFRHLHLEACYRLKPDPKRLAKHLAELANQSEGGLFDGPPDGYSEVLGQEGLKIYAAELQRAK